MNVTSLLKYKFQYFYNGTAETALCKSISNFTLKPTFTC